MVILTPIEKESLQFFLKPLPANLVDPRNHITAAVAMINRDMLTREWAKSIIA
jgi:hypothetical protein